MPYKSKPANKVTPHSWDKDVHKYKVVETVKPVGEVEELDQYVFVIRVRIGKYNAIYQNCPANKILDKKTSDPTFYVDIKSEVLRDILRAVLIEVRGINLREDKPAVWPHPIQTR